MNNDSSSIPRRRGHAADDFESLRSDGIQLVQEVSGKHWTDYNAHDPGITILEQLCYALTDLIYRADLPVEDLITGEDGRIALEKQALHRPEVILPARPTTPSDYRRTILDAVPDVEDVWMDREKAASTRDGVTQNIGVYRLRIRLARTVVDAEAVVSRVREVFHGFRNLGEDLAPQITVARELPCGLRASIEIGDTAQADDVLAAVYSEAERYVAGDQDPTTYAELIARGTSLDQVFAGPLMASGRAEDTSEPGGKVLITDLVSLIRGIDGVTSVRELALAVGGQERRESIDRVDGDSVYYLDVPYDRGVPSGVSLTRGGRPVAVTAAVWARYRELSDAHRHRSHGRVEMSGLYPRPTGRRRDLTRYYSIQNQFPNAFGINSFGVMESARPDARARAAQLKAYLLPLEQIMANFLADVAHLQELFSVEESSGRARWYQELGDAEVPHVAELYRQPAGDFLEKLFADMTDHAERKSRVLDHMLAVFGEEFTGAETRHLGHYYGPDEIGAVIVRHKMEFLRTVVELGRDRAGAVDYTRFSWSSGSSDATEVAHRNVSGFQRRVALLLGIGTPGHRSLVDPMTEQGLRLLRHETFAARMVDRPQLELVDIDETYGRVPRRRVSELLNIDRLRETTVSLRTNLMSDLLFTHGLDLSRYRLGQRDDRFVLVFRPDDGDRWWYVGDFTSREKGWSAANALCTYLLALNVEMEGFHVLEHILLRPSVWPTVDGAGGTRGDVGAPFDFFPFRVSVFFTAWTARCRDPKFRAFAEEAIALNCPAHVHPECHWLEFDEMEQFEVIFQRWLEAKADATATADVLDSAARPLVDFVTARRASFADDWDG